MIPTLATAMERSLTGWQGKVTGTNLAVTSLVRASIDGNSLATPATQPLAGATLAASSTYYYYIPTAGASAVDVTLRTSGATGTGLSSATTIYKVLSDGITEKMNAAGASAAVVMASPYVNGTQVTASITGLRGEQGVLLKIVVPAASTVTFDQADWSAL